MKYDLNMYDIGMGTASQFLRKCYMFNAWLPSNMKMKIRAEDNKMVFADDCFIYIEIKITDDIHNESWTLQVYPFKDQYKMSYCPFNSSLLNREEQIIMYHTNNVSFFDDVSAWFKKWGKLYKVKFKFKVPYFDWDWYLETMNQVAQELKEWC